MITIAQHDEISGLLVKSIGIADTLRRAYSARENEALHGAAWALQDLLEKANAVLRSNAGADATGGK